MSDRMGAGALSKADFKTCWESSEDGGGITFDDVAECAKAWGLFAAPRTTPMDTVLRVVLLAAGVAPTGPSTRGEDSDHE